jgi:predicted  nucleic acid-binding Zn-ribbon protein
VSASANVRSIQALSDLRGAWARFASEAYESLKAAEMQIRRTLEWLTERERYWQRQVSRCQEAVARAQSALARGQNSGSYDHRTGRSYVPDCRQYEQALYQAQRYLRQAQSELRTVLQAIKAVQQATADYQRQAQRLATMLRGDMPKGAALLGRSIAILQSYVAMSAPSGGGGSLGVSSSPTDTSIFSW